VEKVKIRGERTKAVDWGHENADLGLKDWT
jgi:hypothetical protein